MKFYQLKYLIYLQSGQKINVKCDICENQKIISLNRYKINTKDLTVPYACSRKCAEIKNKKTILDKYNVNNISKSKI